MCVYITNYHKHFTFFKNIGMLDFEKKKFKVTNHYDLYHFIELSTSHSDPMRAIFLFNSPIIPTYG